MIKAMVSQRPDMSKYFARDDRSNPLGLKLPEAQDDHTHHNLEESIDDIQNGVKKILKQNDLYKEKIKQLEEENKSLRGE